ncbi:MAG TPA: hypothetical protein VNF00_05950, partial [Candidatus Acidoferrales bacterium]|nr:hypothetical protein [Candidatus Acidoferrales bacterium]
MHYRALCFSALLAVLLGVAGLAFAQSVQSPIRITLDQAIQLALAHNHALLAARTTISQSQADEITANLRPNPVFGADVVGLPVEPADFTADNINQAEFDIGLGYLFERG